MIKRFSQFNESIDETKQLIDDMILEYADKYHLLSVEDYEDLTTEERNYKNGFYSISNEIKTKYFKVDGFPNDAKGYQVSLHIKKLDESEFKEDMLAFIKRVCKTFNFEYDTYFKEYSLSKNYIIAFYNKF